MNSKQNWHRMAALECAAIAWQGRPMIEGEDRTGAILGTADRMLAWLDGYARDSGDPKPDRRQPGGWIGPASTSPDSRTFVLPVVDGVPGVAQKVQGLAEAAHRIRVELANGLSAEARVESAAPEAPPRNMPTEGDGSMTVPVYRFYRQPADPVNGPVKPLYWREDTRNETNRWSLWADAQHWHSSKSFDDPRHLPRDLRRIQAQDLPTEVNVETRHDTEE